MNVIRAWKDAEYREGLDGTERSGLPDNPAGLLDLTDADLVGVEGVAAAPTWTLLERWCPISRWFCTWYIDCF